MSSIDNVTASFSSENFRIGQHSHGNNVAVFQNYMTRVLLRHNPWWLANAPAWSKDIRLSHEALSEKTDEWSANLQELQLTDTLSCPVEISVNDIFGRHLRAIRDIHPGEMLLLEPPMVLAFKPKSPAYCSSCYKRTEEFTCPSCGFFFCGPECLTEAHREECLILQRLGFVESAREKQREERLVWERISSMPPDQQQQAQSLLQQAQGTSSLQRQYDVLQLYQAIPVLRTLITMNQSDLLRDLTLSLQGNLDEKSQRYRMNQKRIVDVIVNKLKVPVEMSFAHQICSIWDTNGFEVSIGWGTRVHGLYPFASLITHDCRANTQQWFTNAGKLVLRAVDHISKGQIITTCYSDPQWANMLRQDHLKVCKQFTCACSRCTDPTEFGTFLGSPLCPNCGGFMISSAPLEPTAHWFCNKGCSHTMAISEIASVGKRIGSQLKGLDPTDMQGINILADQLKQHLHPAHHVLLQLHVSNLRNIAKKDVAELSDDELLNMSHMATLVVGVVRRLEPQLTRLRVCMAREDLRLRLEMLKRHKVSNPTLRDELLALSQQVRDCELVLGWDSRLNGFATVLQDYQTLVNENP